MDDSKKRNSSIKFFVSLVVSISFGAGIIASSIGGILFLSSSAKYLLFSKKDYFSNEMEYRERCRYLLFPQDSFVFRKEIGVRNVFSSQANKQEMSSKDKEEIQLCVDRLQKEDISRFKKKKMQGMIDGLSSLIVGLILILSFKKFFLRLVF